MKDFYAQKREAYHLIDDMVTEGRTEEEILFKLQTRYGFGVRIVKERLDLIERIKKKDR